MKKLRLFLAAALISCFTCITAFAGQWSQDTAGWRYDSGDSTYASDGWRWIDGRFYYFTPDGYCLTGTTTPDGYTVDESGAWTLLDEVVMRNADGSIPDEDTVTYRVGSLAMTLPQEAAPIGQDDEVAVFLLPDLTHVMAMVNYDTGTDVSADFDPQATVLVLDSFMEGLAGGYTSRVPRQLSSGLWMRYDCASADLGGLTTPVTVYARMNGTELQAVMFAGDSSVSTIQADAIMNLCVL